MKKAARKQIKYAITTVTVALVVVSSAIIVLVINGKRASMIKTNLTRDEISEIDVSSEIVDRATDERLVLEEDLSAEFAVIEEEIRKVLGSEVNNYAIHVRDLNSNQEFGINNQSTFPPASIYKVGLAMIIFKDIDAGIIALDDQVTILPEYKVYTFDALAKREGTYQLSVEELLEYLIIHSDNTAMTTLEHTYGGVFELQTRMAHELGVEDVLRLPHVTKAIAIAEMFNILYDQQILSETSTNHLLDLLKKVLPGHNDRIAAGVPEGIEVAHKIGTLNSTYEDAGIIYGEKRDIAIVILNRNTTPVLARQKIPQITEIVYSQLN